MVALSQSLWIVGMLSPSTLIPKYFLSALAFGLDIAAEPMEASEIEPNNWHTF